MTRRETPEYVSPVLEEEDWIEYQQKIYNKWISVFNNDELTAQEIRKRTALELGTIEARSRFALVIADITSRSRIIHEAATAIAAFRAARAKEPGRESERQKIVLGIQSETHVKEAIAIGPDGFNQVTQTRAFGEIDLDDKTPLPPPSTPTLIPPSMSVPPPSIPPKAVMESTTKTITLPPIELDPNMPHMGQKAIYPKTTPIEFLPNTLKLDTSYSFIIDSKKKGK